MILRENTEGVINTLNLIGFIMLLLGLVGLCISVILALAWKILDLMDELSGRKAKRQIQRLKELNVGLGSASSLTTNDLYEVIHSGNLVWEDIDNVKDSRVDFGKVDSEVVENQENVSASLGEEANISKTGNIDMSPNIVIIEEQSSLT